MRRDFANGCHISKSSKESINFQASIYLRERSTKEMKVSRHFHRNTLKSEDLTILISQTFAEELPTVGKATFSILVSCSFPSCLPNVPIVLQLHQHPWLSFCPCISFLSQSMSQVQKCRNPFVTRLQQIYSKKKNLDHLD